MKYIDIHTHNNNERANIQVVNLSVADVVDVSGDGFYSTGIHPWFIIEENVENELRIIENVASKNDIVAIGEAGLDKFADATVELQIDVFRKHIEISEKHNKPLIIHCVRMFNELIRIKKEVLPDAKWIVHGFNSNKQIADELVRNGIFLSFGKALLNKNSNAYKILPEIPLDRIFFETDDSGSDIERIYKSATFALKMDEKEIVKIIENNFIKIFKID